MPNLQGVSGGIDLEEISVSATNAGVVTVSADGESTTRNIANSYDAGNSAGYSAGQTAGYNSGYSAGQTAGYNSGYSAGVSATKVGTAGTGDVRSGKTFTNSSGVGLTGTATILGISGVDGMGFVDYYAVNYTFPTTGYYAVTGTNYSVDQLTEASDYHSSISASYSNAYAVAANGYQQGYQHRYGTSSCYTYTAIVYANAGGTVTLRGGWANTAGRVYKISS